MNNFFAAPTDIWDGEAVRLTTIGSCIIVAAIVILIGIALIVYRKRTNANARITTKQLIFSAMAMALATIASMIKLFEMPVDTGGSVTLMSMLFITLIGYWYGPIAGITTGMAYGLLQFVLEPIFYTIPQMLVDYPLAFGALGLAGFFCSRKHGLQIGYVAGVLGRFVFAFFSGVLFFAAYAPEGMSVVVYSASYNGIYLAAEGIITLIIISIPAVSKALAHAKKMATSD